MKSLSGAFCCQAALMNVMNTRILLRSCTSEKAISIWTPNSERNGMNHTRMLCLLNISECRGLCKAQESVSRVSMVCNTTNTIFVGLGVVWDLNTQHFEYLSARYSFWNQMIDLMKVIAFSALLSNYVQCTQSYRLTKYIFAQSL